MDRSDAAAVIAFAGKPDASRVGSEPGNPQYRALGYGCAAKRTGSLMRTVRGGPACQTVFFLDRRTGKLETFYTASPDYADGHGVRAGMTQAEAERRLHARVTIGCNAALHFEGPKASLSISFDGGMEDGTALTGAHVDALVLHSKRRDAGVFDCL
jgi:hypothetical protein